MSRLTSFLAELRRRRVYQIAAVYAAAAFVGAQAADLFFPRLGLPDWTVTVVIVLAVAGFPAALLLGWVFDVTPAGVRRTGSSEDRHAHHEPPTSPVGPWRISAGVASGLVILLGVGWWLSSFAFSPPVARAERLAVLPFSNLMNDPAQDHFVDGMHDALIGEIGQVPSLLVVSRQSVLQFRNSHLPLPTIARELGVEAVVVGSVYLAGDSVRISAQLVQARPEVQLWTGTYHRKLSDALGRQGEVARAIAEAIHATISPAVAERLAAARSVHPEAQDAFLRGIYHLEQAALGGSERPQHTLAGVARFEEAIALEPDWAAPWARLAVAHHMMAGGTLEGDAEQFTRSRAAALRALELDERESWAHAALGFVRAGYERDFIGAERSYRRALELDPNLHDWRYALFLQIVGRFDEAALHFRRAQERHPLALTLKRQTVTALHCAGQHEQAIAQIREIRLRGAEGILAPGDLEHIQATQYVALGRYREAIAEMERAVAVRDSLPYYVARLAWTHARSGDHEAARALLPWLEARERWFAPELFAVLGDTERALAVLESAPDLPGIWTQFLCMEGYRALSDHPRAREVARRLGLPVEG